MTPVEVLLSNLPDARRTGKGQWQAPCPAHDDRKPSLSIGENGDGAVLLHCHAGCSVPAVVSALGLNMRDLFPDRPETRRPKGTRHGKPAPKTYPTARDAVAELERRHGPRSHWWTYTDAQGEPVGVIVRWDLPKGKDIRPVSRNGAAWIIGAIQEPRPLYGLPELGDAKRVYVCEGEKTVDAYRSVGLTSTTSPGGSKAAHKADWGPLAGKDVVMSPDNDTPGRGYVETAGGILAKLTPPTTVKMVELPDLPPGGDMVDYIEARRAAGLGDAAICAEVEALAEDAPTWTPPTTGKPHADGDGAPPKDEREKPTQAEAIVRLALARYRLGLTDTGEPFAVELGGPNLARVFRGGREAFRAALARDYRRTYRCTANASALADALTTLEGECLDVTPEAVGLRVADYNDGIVLDLGDPEGRAVIVRPGAWEVVSPSPVLFRRTALTAALPLPQRGGSLNDLRGLLNVLDDTWPLVRGWLVAALVPSMPHPILLLGGEQGTGKSTAARMLVNLIDPSPAPLRSEPRDAEGWALAAAGSWAVAVDNVSRIRGWWSDALCRAVSGDGWVRRRLYTDADLSVLAFRRVVILTSIDAGAMRGDLGDRVLLADLARIGEADRKTEADLDRDYAEVRPRVLGGLLDAVGSVLSRLPDTRASALPRMADFGRVLTALDDADGADGRALQLYLAQAGRIAGEVLESDAVAVGVLALLDGLAGLWEGTTAELLDAIRPADKPPRGWPETARALAGRLKRLTPALRAAGVEVERQRTGHDRVRRLTIRRRAENIVRIGRTVRNDAEGRNYGVFCGRSADDADSCGRSGPADRPPDTPQSAGLFGTADDADGCDQPFSVDLLDPNRPGPTDLLNPEQYARYQVTYKAHEGEPTEKHSAAWRAALAGN